MIYVLWVNLEGSCRWSLTSATPQLQGLMGCCLVVKCCPRVSGKCITHGSGGSGDGFHVLDTESFFFLSHTLLFPSEWHVIP